MASDFTKWPKAVSLKEATSLTWPKAYTANCVGWFGVSSELSNDQGPQITTKIWFSISKLLDIHGYQTTFPHSKDLNAFIACLHGLNWIDELP